MKTLWDAIRAYDPSACPIQVEEECGRKAWTYAHHSLNDYRQGLRSSGVEKKLKQTGHYGSVCSTYWATIFVTYVTGWNRDLGEFKGRKQEETR